MAQSRVAERYAKALLDLANERSELKAVYEDMRDLQSTIQGSRELDLLLKNPVLTASKKVSIFSKIFKSHTNPLTFGFMELVLKKRREADFGAIADSFLMLYNEQKGITEVSITTAVSIDQSTLQSIVDKVKDANKLKEVKIEHHVDQSILGGFIAEFNNKILDESLQSNINQIKRRFSVN